MHPSKICDYGVKVKINNIVSYVFLPTHMASLGDLVQAWSGCGSEFNGVGGLYEGTVTVWRD